jgi:hypothetical protein
VYPILKDSIAQCWPERVQVARAVQFSLSDLLPIHYGIIQKDHCFMILKSFFDGGNQADSTKHDVVSLASVSGTLDQWRSFERDWKANLETYGAPYLHTTDAVSLKAEPFTKENGWDRDRRDAFISDCVTIIEAHIAEPPNKTDPHGRFGLLPYVLTVVLKDFLRARDANPEVPKTAEEICAMQTVFRCLQWGEYIGAHFYHLVFDQGEPFMGHVLDRQNNRKAKRHLKAIVERITSIKESNMRLVPALQMADLFAWCINNKRRTPRHKWQDRMLSDSGWINDWLDYDQMVKILPGVSDLVKSGMPGRS